MRGWGGGVRPGTSLVGCILEPISAQGKQGRTGLVLRLGKGSEPQFRTHAALMA